MKKLLLVDDDDIFRYVVKNDLTDAGYEIEESANLKKAKLLMSMMKFDMVLLDICLPDGSGLDWAEEFSQEEGSPPIIFLTTSNDPGLVIRGFNCGCEDYIRKPFQNIELIFRLKRLFKDANDINAQNRQIGKYVFNPITHRLTWDDKCHVLGRLQAAVLDELSIRPGTVVSKEELLNRYWENSNYFTSRNLDSVIVKLRAHFKDDSTVHFLSVKRAGYRLAVFEEGGQPPYSLYV